ncbi:hypothetical protein MKW98_002823 [Papaver atlanticum]|uniref:VWFA domain-containing protein n=1 Tax=Papaver atlanticum TaxID=357466 RepID=A0AAD4X947_9MAGN|nr:hypothetical protein MKW98_002823 [Papaver atlanticum]
MENQIHDDDEPILRLNSEREEEDADIQLEGGKTEVRIFHKPVASLEECPFKVLLKIEGVGADEGRLGVDLVTILNISGSIGGNTLIKMKLAMQFLVEKLSKIDRLSVVVNFNGMADKLCPLRQITETSIMEIVDQVNDLVPDQSSKNAEAGLKLALRILNDRTRTKNRSAAIMLMSDGMEDVESQAISFPVSEVPVYTFAFGDGCNDHEVLREIAKNSKGGTFSPVQDSDDLSVVFSSALSGHLNVSIEDLTLTISPLNRSQLDEVIAGNYPQTKQATVMDPVTVTFRSLYDRETRKVLALLTLPKVDKRFAVQIFKVRLKYRVNGKDAYDYDERTMNVTRTATQTYGEIPEVQAEETRIRTTSSIKEARILADQRELAEARKSLDNADASVSEIDAVFKAQMEQLLLLMSSQETYDKQGKAFALALEASQESQRSVALPAGIASGYDTPLMAEYKEQAKKYDENPQTYMVPTAEEDSKATIPHPSLQL